MIIAELAASAAECGIMSDFLTRCMGMKDDKHRILKIAICSFLLFANVTIWPMITDVELISVAVMMVIEMAYCVLFLNGSVFKKVFFVFINSTAIMLINVTVLMLLELVLSADMGELLSGSGIARLLVLFLTKFLFFLTTRIILRIKGGSSYNLSRSEWITVLAVFVVTFIIGIAVLECTVNEANAESFMMASVVGLILINIMTYVLMLRMNKENAERTKAMLLEIQIKENTESIREIHRMYEEIKQIRHDTKHWISGSLALMKQKNYDEAERYLEKLADEKIGTIKDYVMTENDVINAIINSKLSEASQKGIEVRSSVGIELGTADVYGLGVTLANLLDNAIEGCMRSPDKKEIYFEMYVDGEYLKIFVRNSYDKGGIDLRTKKPNKRLHGFGTKGISDFAKKNGGILNFYEENGDFCVDLWVRTKKGGAG